ncbi:MAG: glycosyltransferase family 61 protein [Pseudomonadota bacterium]
MLERTTRGEGYKLRPMFALRQSLVGRLGPQEGFAAWQGALPQSVLPPASAIRHVPLIPMFEAVADIAHIAPGGRPIEATPPRVIGHGNHRVLRKTGRAIYTGRLNDVLLFGGSGAMITDQGVAWDFEGDEIAATADAIDLDPALVSYDPVTENVWALDHPGDVLEVQSGFNLLGWSTGHFGHWMMEYLPKFILAQSRGSVPFGCRVLVDDGMPQSHYDALTHLLPDGVEMQIVPRFAPVRVQHLRVISSLNYGALAPQSDSVPLDQGAVDPELFSTAAGAMAAKLDDAIAQTDAPEKVYLSRRAFARRALLNVDAIEDVAREEGFSVVQPESLCFFDQFRCLRGARVIAGPEGSSMMLGMFCRPGVQAVLLNHEETEHLATLSAALERGGARITVLTGPEEATHGKFAHNASYRIDPEAFRQLLRDAAAAADK